MNRGTAKAERLREMERLYIQHQEGLTNKKLAERFGVDPTTIFRDRKELERETPFIEVEPGHWAIDRMKYLSEIRVNLTEALALYLAARRMSRHTHTYQTHVVSALEKLAAVLKEPMTARLVKVATAMAQHPPNPERVRILDALTEGWAQHIKVSLTYQGLRADRPTTHRFSPYLIEPSVWSDAIYVIGHSDVFDDRVTFSVERIQRASLTTEPFAIPETFDEQELLRFAWGIWTSKKDPVTVKLRFTGKTAITRLKESIWHPLQKPLLDTDDGACIWKAPVAEWREMLPWIRGWGSDVEVLEPPDLREELMQEATRLAKLYNVGGNHSTNSLTTHLLRCWGKTKRYQDTVFHPALFHMLDVGHVARALLTDPASARWRRVLAAALNADTDALAHWLPYIIAMHDIGKFTAAFQKQNITQCKRLQVEGFPFDGWKDDMWQHHTILGQAYLQHEQTTPPLADAWRDLWRDVIGGHHGKFGARRDVKTAHTRLTHYEPALWRDLRDQADRLLRQYLLTRPVPAAPPTNLAAATIALTGFTILCDWLGSDEKFFPPAADFDLPTYTHISADRARRAVQAAGFFQPTRSSSPATFGDLFPDKQPPRPLQAAVDTIPQDALSGPALVIIEAPTGEGKTEAALAIAHRLAQASGTDALYYALPTTATSNQMFTRVREHLGTRLGLPHEVQLIHGQAHLRDDDLDAQPLDNGKASSEDAVAWFTSKKRAILAPFGVGTVDQAELAALNVKHVALRLMGLAGKVVIFDEVHAYDTYMTTIIERLLEWLSALGTSVIILSATLPQKQRATLAQAYGTPLPLESASQAHTAQAKAYPSLWVLPRDGVPYHDKPPAYQQDRPLKVQYLHLTDDDPAGKAQWLLDAVRDGGCACWITNTVARAQDIYHILRDAPEVHGIDLDLLHARFPLADRERREKQLTTKYGPPPEKETSPNPRPQRGIVIGTQVLEQSLDLDFDVMVSDLAPIDLLLQRAGRLQRHARPRPDAYAAGPTLWVNVLQCENGALDLGTDAIIYDEYLLRQTWHTLENYTGVLHLPHDYRPLVEAVYRETGLALNAELVSALGNLQIKQSDAIKQANERLLPASNTGKSFCRRSARITFEEDETGASWIVAQTRLGRESVNLIPLEKLDETTARLYPAGEPLRLDRRASSTVQRHLLRHHLRVSRPELVRALKHNHDLPALFTKSPRLKGYYPLYLENGAAHFSKSKGEGELVVTLDDDLGLVITSS